DEGLAGIHEHAGLEAPYGRERGVELGLPGYADELFDVVIPGSDVVVTNGPVDAMSIPLVLFEIDRAPARRSAPPHERFAAEMIAADPPKRARGILAVRLFGILDPELLGRLAERITRTLDRVVAFVALAIAELAEGELPGGLVLAEVVGRSDRAPPLEQQHLQALLGELLCGPASGNAGANNDRVVVMGHRLNS